MVETRDYASGSTTDEPSKISDGTQPNTGPSILVCLPEALLVTLRRTDKSIRLRPSIEPAPSATLWKIPLHARFAIREVSQASL